jgi:hypothetical protein
MSDHNIGQKRGFWSRLFFGGGEVEAPARQEKVEARTPEGAPVESKATKPLVDVAPTRFDKTERAEDKKEVEKKPPPPPPRLLGDLPAGTPIALTDRSRAAGAVPPKDPRIFIGAQVMEEGGGVKGTLVGYTSGWSASFLVRDASGQEHRLSSIEVPPGQQFKSVAETLAPGRVYKVSSTEKKALDQLLQHGVGSGRSNVGGAITAIRDAGFEAFVAGGAVRDVLQGGQPRDVDLATTMWIKEADRAMSRAGISTGFVRSDFGTMIVGRGGSNALDVCSLKRGKGSFGFDLMEDIKSRDFTINAMFYDPSNGTILDPTGRGVQDARAKVLRPACEPGKEKQWLDENPSAVLRFLKFTMRGYSFDPALMKLVKDNFASCVRRMDGLRRDRQLDSVYQGSGREEKITAEMKRLGFPQSDIEALFPSRRWFGGFSRDDDDDKPRTSGGAGGFTGRSSGPGNSGSSSSSTGNRAGATPSFVASGYVGPSLKAVNEYAAATKREVVDYGPRYNSSAAAELGALPPSESDAWGSLFPNGWRKRDQGVWTHRDGSFVHFTGGNVFRGVGNKVFAGRPPTSGGGSAGPGRGTTAPPADTAPPPSNRGPAGPPSSIGGGGGGRFSGAMASLMRQSPWLKATSPSFGQHGKLAVATGHLGRLPSIQQAAAEELVRKGFTQKPNGAWEHKDGSWVRFHEGGVFRGHQNEVFTAMVMGPGPGRGDG